MNTYFYPEYCQLSLFTTYAQCAVYCILDIIYITHHVVIHKSGLVYEESLLLSL